MISGGISRERHRGQLGLALLSAMLALAASPARAGVGRIANLSDAAFTSVNPMVTQTAVDRVCVFSDTGRYRVTATGSGVGGAFSLSAGAGLDLPYGVQWSDSATASSGTALVSGSPLTGQTTPLLSLCALGATSGSLFVTLSAADLQTAVAGVSYAGVVTLVVAPE